LDGFAVRIARGLLTIAVRVLATSLTLIFLNLVCAICFTKRITGMAAFKGPRRHLPLHVSDSSWGVWGGALQLPGSVYSDPWRLTCHGVEVLGPWWAVRWPR